MNPVAPPPSFLRVCHEQGVLPTRWLLSVSIRAQRVSLFCQLVALNRFNRGAESALPFPKSQWSRFILQHSFRCSTSRFGPGQIEGSNRTPLGLHRIAEKIGGGLPVGTVFRARQPVGLTWHGLPQAMITTRILWLDGLEPGFNRGGNVDSHSRYIYIHGTGDESTLGRPSSCGCIHLAANDLIPLFDKIPSGTLVWIEK
jgi:hypothetical protein